MMAGMQSITADDILADLRAVQALLGYINQEAYIDHGQYAIQTIRRRCGSWVRACEAAGLESRSHQGRNPVVIDTEPRRCLGTGPDHVFAARRDDLTHRICDACKRHPHLGGWERRIDVADGWEVVAG